MDYRLKDKEKLFLYYLLLNRPVPARTRQDRGNIADFLNCSDRTVHRVLHTMRTTGAVEIDESKNYRLPDFHLLRLQMFKLVDDMLDPALPTLANDVYFAFQGERLNIR